MLSGVIIYNPVKLQSNSINTTALVLSLCIVCACTNNLLPNRVMMQVLQLTSLNLVAAIAIKNTTHSAS